MAAASQRGRDRAVGPLLTRREAMVSTGQIVVAVGVTALPVACTKPIEQTWSDDMFWNDGTGWVS